MLLLLVIIKYPNLLLLKRSMKNLSEYSEEQLPEELIPEILKYLSYNEVVETMRVNKTWRFLISTSQILFHYFNSDIRQSILTKIKDTSISDDWDISKGNARFDNLLILMYGFNVVSSGRRKETIKHIVKEQFSRKPILDIPRFYTASPYAQSCGACYLFSIPVLFITTFLLGPILRFFESSDYEQRQKWIESYEQRYNAVNSEQANRGFGDWLKGDRKRGYCINGAIDCFREKDFYYFQERTLDELNEAYNHVERLQQNTQQRDQGVIFLLYCGIGLLILLMVGVPMCLYLRKSKVEAATKYREVIKSLIEGRGLSRTERFEAKRPEQLITLFWKKECLLENLPPKEEVEPEFSASVPAHSFS